MVFPNAILILTVQNTQSTDDGPMPGAPREIKDLLGNGRDKALDTEVAKDGVYLGNSEL